MFSQADIQQIKAKGMNPTVVESQLESFRTGFPFVILNRPATAGDGILQLGEDETESFVEAWNASVNRYRISKFVPASGAATRMFKDLFSFMDSWNGSEDLSAPLEEFFTRLDEFAFWDDLRKVLSEMPGLEEEFSQDQFIGILKGLLLPGGLNYGNLPKGLLKFHQYNNYSRTAFEEHLAEGALTCKNEKGEVNIHFTVTPEHESLFLDLLNSVRAEYERAYGCKYNISFSVQNPASDTIAVNPDNTPFREKDGGLLFRPAGHGALLFNLNDQDADIISIKNIDNVVPDRLKEPTVTWKKVLGGLLVGYRNKIHQFLSKQNVSESETEEMIRFAEQKLFLNCDFCSGMNSAQKSQWLKEYLDRPLRICGMVKNQGEPGGGPFWVNDASGKASLQIIESSQVNQADKEQSEIFSKATHFNPVDLICSVTRADGSHYNLQDFADPSTGFISKKSSGGRDLKAMELPGLWNGAMANWITVFVEVPLITFNPVKTVNDLLRPEHM